MKPLSEMQQIVYDAFVAQGLPPALGLALAEQESAFKPDASVVTGGDGARGGAWGLGQVTLKTALALDKTATTARLLNPLYNAKIMALLCKEIWAQQRGRVVDTASVYNSGKPQHRAPEVTRMVYVPKVLERYNKWTERLIALGLSASVTPAKDA